MSALEDNLNCYKKVGIQYILHTDYIDSHSNQGYCLHILDRQGYCTGNPQADLGYDYYSSTGELEWLSRNGYYTSASQIVAQGHKLVNFPFNFKGEKNE